MNKKTSRGLFPLLILLAALASGCKNPFFADLLGINEKNGDSETPWSYTVTFKSNDGSNDTLHTKTVTEPALTIPPAEFPANPSRTGAYAFAGWNTQPDGGGSAFTASTTVSADITVYAQWTPIPPGSHTVTFKLNDGTDNNHAVKTVTPPADTVADFPANPSRTGAYAFAGWNTQPGGGGNAFTASTIVSGDIRVYAQWTPISPNSYTVTFKLNDGTDNNHAVKTVTSPANTVADFPTDPTRNGYNFTGWDIEQNGGGGGAFTSSTTVSGDIRVYAQWTPVPPNSYTVTFKLNDGTETNHAVKTVTSPANTVADFPADPSRTDYNFTGWNTQQNGGGGVFTSSTTVSGDITVYAQWTAIPPSSHTVTFKLNDGTNNNHAVKTVTSPATTVTDFPTVPTRTDYTFAAWNTQQNGGGNAFTASTIVSDDITVYAQWTAIPPNSYTVTFKLNDGTETNHAVKTVTSPATTVTDFPTVPTRTDYNFTGWNTEQNGGGGAFTASTTVSDDITVYAQWTAKSYTVTFMSNYPPDTVLGTATVTVPATTVADFPTDPARPGYNFTGWDTEQNGGGNAFTASTTVSVDITVYAQWTAKSYTVTFMSNYPPDTVLGTATVTVPANTVAEFPADPSRTDYTFAGWNTQQSGGGSAFTSSTTVDADITVYAQWTATNTGTVITLSFDAGDGAFSETIFTIYKSGGTGSRTVSLTGSGYTSPRWYVDGDPRGTGASVAINAADYGAGSHVLTLIAAKDGLSWSKELAFTVEAGDLRTVVFRTNDGGGAIYAVKTTAPGTAISGFPAAPSRTGYDFGEWNTQPGGGGSPFTASTTVNADTTVYAQWNPKTWTIVFKRNYDADTTLYTETVTVPNTAVSPFPANPGRTDYNFAGWNTQANGSGTAFHQNSPVHGDMTVYAQWAYEQFDITLNLDAGDDALSETSFTISKTTGTGSRTINVSGSGYTNSRWYVDGDPRGTGTSITINAADYGAGGHILTLFVSKSGVSWSKELSFTVSAGIFHTVTFRTNDGTGTVWTDKTVIPPAATVTDFPAEPTRTGYDFAGWDINPGGGGGAFDSSTSVNADITVYAQWDPKTWTVVFKRNYDADTTLYTETVTVPATTISAFPGNPNRTGYNFAGWNTQANGSGTAFGQNSPVHGNMTVYAQWAYEQFDITLNLDAGDGAFSEPTFTIYKSGGTGSRAINVTGSGYTNPRWYVDGDPRGTGTSITIDAADYGAGGHILTLFVSRNGVSWSKELSFTVSN